VSDVHRAAEADIIQEAIFLPVPFQFRGERRTTGTRISIFSELVLFSRKATFFAPMCRGCPGRALPRWMNLYIERHQTALLTL